jgi:hypothetical protein
MYASHSAHDETPLRDPDEDTDRLELDCLELDWPTACRVVSGL